MIVRRTIEKMMQVDFLLRPQYLRWGGIELLKEAAILALDRPHCVDFRAGGFSPRWRDVVSHSGRLYRSLFTPSP